MEKIILYIKNNQLTAQLFTLGVLAMLVAFFYNGLGYPPIKDAVTYHDAMEFILGRFKGGDIPYNRLLTTPLMLYFSLSIGSLIGNLYFGMMSANIIMYFALIYFFHQLALRIYRNETIAFFSSVFLVGNYYLINDGAVFVADIGGWLFFIVGTYLAVSYHQLGTKKYFYLAIAASSIGVLFKEWGALGLITLNLLILTSQKTIIHKIKECIWSGLIFAILPLTYHTGFYFYYHYSYLDWYRYMYDVGLSKDSGYNFVLFIKVMGWLFTLGWPIAAYGVWQEYKEKNIERIKILVAMLPASLTFLAWMLVQRVAFILVPWLALAAGFGLSKIKNKYAIYAIITIYLLINFNIKSLLKIINLPF